MLLAPLCLLLLPLTAGNQFQIIILKKYMCIMIQSNMFVLLWNIFPRAFKNRNEIYLLLRYMIWLSLVLLILFLFCYCLFHLLNWKIAKEFNSIGGRDSSKTKTKWEEPPTTRSCSSVIVTPFNSNCALPSDCPRQCSGKGRCVVSQCQCVDGWSGDDCSVGACGTCYFGQCEAGFCHCEVTVYIYLQHHPNSIL
jgi:hypothetical protein